MPKADEEFLAGKAKKRSRACAACRKKRRAQHIRDYYRKMPSDQRNTVTMRRRADAYGVRSEDYSRADILRRWRFECCYCGARAEHLDHVHPLSRGGEDVIANIVPACSPCNLSKGAKSLAEWALTWAGEVNL